PACTGWAGSASGHAPSLRRGRRQYRVYRITLGVDAPDQKALEALLPRGPHQVEVQLERFPGPGVSNDLPDALDPDFPGIRPLVYLDLQRRRIDLRPPLELLNHPHDSRCAWAAAHGPLEVVAQLRSHAIGAPDE